MKDKYITIGLILAVICTVVAVVEFYIHGVESEIVPLFMTLSVFFFISVAMYSLDFGGEEIIIENSRCSDCPLRCKSNLQDRQKIEVVDNEVR